MDKGSNDTAEKYLAKKNNDSTAKVLRSMKLTVELPDDVTQHTDPGR